MSQTKETRYLGLYESIINSFPDLPGNVQVIEIKRDGELNLEELAKIEFLPIPLELRRQRLPDLLSHLTSLKILQTFSAGVDHTIPLVPPGVTLCSARGAHDVSVAEWIIAVLLSRYRQLHKFQEKQNAATWDRATFELATNEKPSIGSLKKIQGSRVLVVGHGSIGRAVAERLAPFGVHLTGISRRPRPGVLGLAELDKQLPQADIIILLAPLLPETRHIVNADFISKTKQGAFIINAGRGGLIDPEALEAALHANRIQAALDVTEPEPLPDGHSLWTAPNLTITPHIAGAVEGWREPAFELITHQIRQWAAGEPLANVVADGY